MGGAENSRDLSRRTFLRLGGDLALIAAAPTGVVEALFSADAAQARGAAGHYLTADRMATLEKLCDRMIPGSPTDPDPGALDANVPAYIDLLLGAFTLELPPVYAGGPFSDRAGGEVNDFAAFLELDELEELIWLTRIEGSRGMPEREWNGPVKGLQQIYDEGLDALDRISRTTILRRPFAEAPNWLVDFWINFAPRGQGPFLDTVFAHACEGMYGAPEYGANAGLVGWTNTQWPGDVAPRGFSDDEVTRRDADTSASHVERLVPKGAVRG